MKRRDMLGLGAAAAAGALTAGLPAPAIAQGKMVLKASDVHPEGYPTVVAVENLGKKLSAATDGRLSVQMYASSQLGDEKAAIEQAQVGAIQICRVSVGALGPVVDRLNVFNLPFIFRDSAHMRKVIDGAIGDALLGAIEATPNSNMIGLAWMDAGARSVYNRVHPVRTIADLKGLKIRVIPNPIFLAMINDLGANGITMGYDQVFSALQTGVIDGAENNPPSYVFDHHYEAAKYFTFTEHLIVPEILAYSGPGWARLSKSDQALLRKLGREAQFEERALWDAKVAQALAMMKKAHIQMVDNIDKAPFRAAVKPVWEKYGAKYTEVIQQIQAVG